MSVDFKHEGDTIDYTPTADVAAGVAVSLASGNLFGLAVEAIPANKKGALSIRGVAEATYSTTVASLVQGGTATFDFTAQIVEATTGTVVVKLSEAPGASVANRVRFIYDPAFS